MRTPYVYHSETSATNLETNSPSDYGVANRSVFQPLSFQWRIVHDSKPTPVAYGQVGYLALVSRFSDLLKLERQIKERTAAVSLNSGALQLMDALDKETSIRWEDLPERSGGDWMEACRAATLLAGANLCDASPTRLRLTEHGHRMLGGAELSERMDSEVGPPAA